MIDMHRVRVTVPSSPLFVLLALVACHSGSDTPGPEEVPAEHAVPGTPPSARAPAQTEVVAVTIPSLGLQLSVPAAAEEPLPEARSTDEGTFLFSESGVLRTVVAAGPDQTLARRTQLLGASLGDPRSEEGAARDICGQSALVRVFYLEIQRAVGFTFNDEEHLVHQFPPTSEPFETHVTAELVVRNTPVLITWVVPTSERHAYAEAEEAFFASIQCVD